MNQSKRRARLPWILGALAVVAIVFLLAVAIHARQTAFSRYVSPPLADGTRYTFLYPSDAPQVSANRFGDGSVCVDYARRKLSRLDRLLEIIHLPPTSRRGESLIMGSVDWNDYAKNLRQAGQTRLIQYDKDLQWLTVTVSIPDAQKPRLFTLR